MKKFLFVSVIVLLVTNGYSQLNNSWIDHSKTYFRFKLAKDTLSRINQRNGWHIYRACGCKHIAHSTHRSDWCY